MSHPALAASDSWIHVLRCYKETETGVCNLLTLVYATLSNFIYTRIVGPLHANIKFAIHMLSPFVFTAVVTIIMCSLYRWAIHKIMCPVPCVR